MKEIDHNVFTLSQISDLISIFESCGIDLDFESDAQVGIAFTQAYCKMLEFFECDELNSNQPSVESVLNRLARHTHMIVNVTCIVKWSTGEFGVYYNTKKTAALAFDAAVLNNFVNNEIEESKYE